MFHQKRGFPIYIEPVKLSQKHLRGNWFPFFFPQTNSLASVVCVFRVAGIRSAVRHASDIHVTSYMVGVMHSRVFLGGNSSVMEFVA